MDALPARSLFFFTFHKCASVLFGCSVLPNARGLELVDEAARRFRDPTAEPRPFLRQGRLYGPLRLSAKGEVLERLVKPALKAALSDDVRACLMVRDPRDCLVSRFFHDLRDRKSTESKRALTWEAARAHAMALGIDRFALDKAPQLEAGFGRAVELLTAKPSTRILRYEDMVDDWLTFRRQLQDAFELPEDALELIERESRPNETERIGAHKRSGATGDHRRKLAPETLKALTERFDPFLRRFGYLPGS